MLLTNELEADVESLVGGGGGGGGDLDQTIPKQEFSNDFLVALVIFVFIIVVVVVVVLVLVVVVADVGSLMGGSGSAWIKP